MIILSWAVIQSFIKKKIFSNECLVKLDWVWISCIVWNIRVLLTIGLLSHTKCCATEKMENDQLNAPCNKIRVQIRVLDFTTQDHKYRNSRSILPNSLSPSRPITTVFPLLFVCQLALVAVCMTPSTSDWSQMTSTKTDHAANNQPAKHNKCILLWLGPVSWSTYLNFQTTSWLAALCVGLH